MTDELHVEQYRDVLDGVLSCYDRIRKSVISRTLNGSHCTLEKRKR